MLVLPCSGGEGPCTGFASTLIPQTLWLTGLSTLSVFTMKSQSKLALSPTDSFRTKLSPQFWRGMVLGVSESSSGLD